MVQRPSHKQRPHGNARPNPPRDAAEQTYGLRAALAVHAKRPEDILQVAYTSEARHEAGPFVRWASSKSVPSRELKASELDRLAESRHHEGLLVEAKARRWLNASDLGEHLARANGMAIALDRVRNPYNVGAIVRSAAFFGVEAILLGAPAPHPGLSPTAVQVAEGGCEHVHFARTTDLADTLARLRTKGVRIVGADGQSKVDARRFAFGRPVVLVVGNEREGLGDRVRAQCDAVVSIPGTGAIESLNVAIATSVLLAEMTRR